MSKLLIATTNQGKFKELTALLKAINIRLVSLKDLGITKRPIETGKTFEENAVLKAKYYQKLSGLPTLADDGGLEIDALNGEPGVNSHRWVNIKKERNDEELINFTLLKLKNIPLEKRGAQLRVVLALAIDSQRIITSEGKVRGIIPFKISENRMPGYPFRSMLLIPAINKFYNEYELTKSENESYNHRRKALFKIKPIIKKIALVQSSKVKVQNCS